MINNNSKKDVLNCQKSDPEIESLIVDKKQCSENSLIYSGQITGFSLSTCIVFCGTAFGNIHIWAPWTSLDDSRKNVPIISLAGPKVSI